MEKLSLTYRDLKNPLLIIGITFFVVLTYLGLIYFNPMNNQWLGDGSFSWTNTLQFVLVDQIGIEFFTYAVISLLIIVYAKLLGLNNVDLSIRGIVRYQLRFFPLFAIAFIIFNPVTQTIRYVYHNSPPWSGTVYLEDYFYSGKLYLTYLLPSFLGGYALLNVNLYMNYTRHISSQKKETAKTNRIEAFDQEGKTLLDVNSIISFERIGRNYYAYMDSRKARVNYTLNELEQILPAVFYRISRSCIINISYLKNYSFWENDKYIIRLRNGKEFVSSRSRIRELEKLKISKNRH